MRRYILINAASLIALSLIIFGCAGAQPPGSGSGPADATGLDDSGFRPNPNGFGFENYGDNVKSVDLTSDEMRKIFGDKVCASTKDGKCVLTHPAKRWMDEAISAMESGHCEGMAVLSDLIYFGLINPVDLGGSTAMNLSIDNEKLQREIGRWWSTQLTSPGSSTKIYKSPNAVFDALAAAFKDGNKAKEWWAMGIYMPDGSGGHAITPFAVQDFGNGTARISVYDNNWPGEIRYVDIDRNANTWRYQASINPDEPTTLYTGNATTKNLEIVSITPRLAQQECDFCDDSNSTVINNSKGTKRVQVWQKGKANSLVSDKGGRRVGYTASGELVNEIPGAEIRNIKLASNSTHPPVIFIPIDTGSKPDLKVTVSSAASGEEANEANTTILAPGLAVAFSNPDLAEGGEQNISIAPAADGYAVSFSSNQEISPTIAMDTDLNRTVISGATIQPGGNISVDMNQTDNSLKLISSGNQNAGTVKLNVTSIDQKSGTESTYSSSGVQLKENYQVSLSFAGSAGGMSIPSISIDHGDGIIEAAKFAAVSTSDILGAGGLGAGIPNTTTPGASIADVGRSDMGIPDAAMLDSGIPDLSTPGMDMPGVSAPETGIPAGSSGISTPGISSPGTINPGISAPDVSSPGTSNSGISTPDISSPSASNSDISTPGISTPDIIAPGISAPGVTVPGANNTGIGSPGIASPGIGPV